MTRKVKMSGRTDYASRRDLAKELTKSGKFLGMIVTWNSGVEGATHKHIDLVNALSKCSLDSKYARELLPRNAFSRAAKKLSEERVIDVFQETETEMVFQFTKKHLNTVQWEFKKESFVRLNKITGKVQADEDALEATAQAAVDLAMEVRTNADVTRIVNRLFMDHADLIPLRDAGGVYFIPQEHVEFTTKVKEFLKELGGFINRIPVPAGTEEGDVAIKDAVATAMSKLINDHMEAVKGFEVSTRKDTIARTAEEIKRTRIRIEAYAHYLGERQSELLAKIGEANQLLKEEVERIGGGKEAYTEYDWDKILDGKVYKLIQGEDYLGKAISCLTRARHHAKRNGMSIRSRVLDDGNSIVLQAVPMEGKDNEE